MKLYIADVSSLLTPSRFARLYPLVSQTRQEKIDRLRMPRDKSLCLGTGLLLQWALMEARITQPRFAYGRNGKPYLENDPHVHFNLSHSGLRAICVLADTPVGCDVEEAGKYRPEIAARFFAPVEYQALLAQPEEERDGCFTRLWTLKESFLKATGLGLSVPLDAFAIRLGREISLVQNLEEGSFRFLMPDLQDGYHYAVCAKNAPEANLELIQVKF